MKNKVTNGIAEFGVDSQSDCPDLHMAILSAVDGSHVRIAFCQPISYLHLPPEEALRLAGQLTESANKCLAVQRASAEHIH